MFYSVVLCCVMSCILYNPVIIWVNYIWIMKNFQCLGRCFFSRPIGTVYGAPRALTVYGGWSEPQRYVVDG